MTWFCF